MADSSLNHYEKRLYSVFKTFDVDDEEALNRAAVVALCDALQLEQRGAGGRLVEALFERRPAPSGYSEPEQRVTFAQFRSGLLSVLGEPSDPAPAAAPPPPPPGTLSAEPAASDEDSSGREVAPKFVFGSKKYGRRSRPASRGRVASPARALAAAAPPSSPPPASPPSPPPELDHASVVDCERALQLCRRLRMSGIDRRLVHQVFDGLPGGVTHTTVGDFFDRLNASLTVTMDGARSSDECDEERLSKELVVEAWEKVGVTRPRRLLAEMCGPGPGEAVPAARLARLLAEEVRAVLEGGEGSGHGDVIQAALGLAQLRVELAARNAAEAAGERDRLRADLEEANRRARLLAQDVDESHARLEAETATALRRADARHADSLRVLETERAAERDRAAADIARMEAELARRSQAEAAARGDADLMRARCLELETRAALADEQRAAAERERDRITTALQEAEERVAAKQQALETERAAFESHSAELRAETVRLRDRVDELTAQLEARPAPAAAPPAPPPAPAWLHEAATVGAADAAGTHSTLDSESPPVSLEASAGAVAEAAAASVAVESALGEAEARHRDECEKLHELVRELESSLELLRDEYERCEEYWSGKLAEERAALAGEQRAADERLAQLARKVDEYERQFAARPRLPAIAETPALECQAAELETTAAELRRKQAELQEQVAAVEARGAELARREAALLGQEEAARRRHSDLQRHERHLARLAHTMHTLRQQQHNCGDGVGPVGGAVEAELRARAARAEATAARLAARLAAADKLVKDLYVENCHLMSPLPHPAHPHL